MQQEFLMLADGAEAANGKIFILGGGVDRHLAPGFPTPLKADVALGFLVQWGETNNRHAVSLRILDEDDQPVATVLDGEFEVGRPPGAKPGQDLRQLIAIKGPLPPIPKAGAYKIVLELDGHQSGPPFRFWVDRVEVIAAPTSSNS
jgi:hypothetical protein